MSPLLRKQMVFAQLLARLLQQAEALGFGVTMGETYRSPQEAARLAQAGLGIRNSLHTKRLAVDLHLFKDGSLLVATEDYKALGDWWEAQSGEGYTCHWGGHFNDGGHFSIGHEGRK